MFTLFDIAISIMIQTTQTQIYEFEYDNNIYSIECTFQDIPDQTITTIDGITINVSDLI